MRKSLLDQIENTRVDVSKAIAKEDISGSCYKLDPKTFKYVLVIPVWQIEMQWAKYEDLLPYINDIDYLFRAFTHDYQILLRKSDDNPAIQSEYFIKSPPGDNLLNQHPNSGPLYDMKIKKYSGGIFVQFNTSRDWTYKTIYRFLNSLLSVLCRYENVLKSGKDLFIYRRYTDEAMLFNNYWNTEILNKPLHKFMWMLNLKKHVDLSSHDLITKVYSNATILTHVVRHFTKPDFDNTHNDYNMHKMHIYNNCLIKMKSPFRYQVLDAKDIFK